MSNFILQTNNLDIGYVSKQGNTSILKNLSLKIDSPKFIAIIGNNGSGKSTLLRTLATIQPKLKGNLFLNKKNTDNLNPTQIAKNISIVFTEKIPESNLTVFDVIGLGRQLYTNWIGTLTAKDLEIVTNIIEHLNLGYIQHKKVHELSDGQYQKVMIARAIAQDTPIILLDEPTSHLDINNKIEVYQLLKNLVKNENKTVIVTSHEVSLLLPIIDDVWLIHKSQLTVNSKKECVENNLINKLISSESVSFNKDTFQYVWR